MSHLIDEDLVLFSSFGDLNGLLGQDFFCLILGLNHFLR
uniref:Uncharacterized protein n=1 Tax=Rhizophora mucronata TaxID=61149 RepID=A0A2P2KCY5_RHIMU